MTPQTDTDLNWEGQPMLARGGDALGTIEEIYLVEETGRPEWAVVRLAGLGRGRTLVPLAGAARTGNGIRAAYEKDVVHDAPRIGGDEEPSTDEVADVYRHYGVAYGPDRGASGGNGAAAAPAGRGARDRPSPARSARDGRGAGPGLGATLKRTAKEFSDDNLTHWAAALTYYGVLSIFPALLALVSILGLVGSSAIQPLMDNLTTVAPGPAREIVSGALKGLQQSSGTGVVFVVALAGAIWSASGYISAFMDASNAVYDIEEGRPIWKKLPLRIGITLLMLVLLAAGAVAVVLTGPVAEQAGRLFGVGDTALQVWNVAKWPVLVLIAAFMFAVLYYSAPNVKQPGVVRSVLPGGVLAVVLWIVASAAFALYVASFASYNKTYGALGGVIVFLVWLWLTNLAILLGAEFNAERARTRNIKAGHPADQEPYLPPRSRP
jgi:membrane protein